MPSADLVLDALNCEPMARARELAEWIGDMRELTSAGVLRPAAAVEACRALGIELPSGKLRSAKDVPELQQAWEVAVAGELVLVTANRARAARDVAELGADPDLRFTALQIAREQGSAGSKAWREYAKEPGFGAHARQWLAAQGEPVTEDDRDESWLLVETIVHAEDGALPSGQAPFLFAGAIRQMVADGADIEAVLAGIRGCGHPRAAQVAAVLSAAVNTLASPFGGLIGPGGLVVAFDDDDDDIGNGALFQLKITLRGVSKPPVSRRALVPAAITLDELHEVILGAMGWIGGHLHVFDDHFTEYGVPGDELGFEDEADVALADLMTELGDRVVYTYDFGDDWTHDIKLEKVLLPDPAARVPVCLAGKGACPPEDCGGAWAYAELKEEADGSDPAAFSIDAVNARLRHISVAAHPVRKSVGRDR